MTVNLPWAYTPLLSEPRSTEMAFYAPGQPDFQFHQGETIHIVCQPMRRVLNLEWALCRSGLTTPLRWGQGILGFDNSVTIPIDTACLTPGTYDIRVRVGLSREESLTGITTFGWHAMEEPLVRTEPDGFVSYWQNTVAALRNAPLDLHVEQEFTLRDDEIDTYNYEQANLPENYDPEGVVVSEVNVYRVDFAAPGGGRIYGRFACPAGNGPFPALLVLPGAGNRPRPAPVEHARHGYAALDIQVHGLPTDLPDYPPLPEPSSDWYDSIEGYPHYDVYRNVMRAVDALLALPGVDTDRVAVVGGSQGGRLAIVIAALDERIHAAVPAIAHFSYCPYVRWRERMNAQGDSGVDGFSHKDVIDDAQTHVESFFDILNFAPLVRCPVLMNAGLIDPVSSPSAIFALYRTLDVPKEIQIIPNMGHDWSTAFQRHAWRWLEKTLDVPRAGVKIK